MILREDVGNTCLDSSSLTIRISQFARYNQGQEIMLSARTH